MIPGNAYVVQRFTLKALILATFLGVTAHLGSPAKFGSICLFAGAFDVGLALLWEQRLLSATFTYWDEAAWFLAIGSGSGLPFWH